ncbi:MAG: sigma-54-dependent Fis family transcriptional regulator [Gammaproteobacteria bacterium]|nr:sigma-54-dependent Fis family transcriptional regulator [Gammaproteobacteria bacterium]MCP5199593.1 sigma-54-dependent Fis family transcriptional regulator [Gammaproteobacteria bacterium]
MPSALVVDDDTTFRQALQDYLRDHGYDVREAQDCAGALDALRDAAPDLLLVDLVLPDGSGLGVVEGLAADAATRVLVVTGHPSVETAVAAVRARVDEYLVKPVGLDDLRGALARLEQASGAGGAAAARDGAAAGLVLGSSAAMAELDERISRVAPMDATVLIQGESGTGKERVAVAVHERSGRAGAFVAVNCGAIPENLIASELFGHEKGAFTGAERRRPGLFERAAGGTVFLDEITEMPPEQQVNLLRVLETASLTRVGGTQELPVDVRVVAATNRNPDDAVAEGALREDLYYRLMVYPLRVPPLRERPEDIAALAQHFLDAQNAAYGTAKTLTEAALARLTAHTWPGNVRELKHTIQRMYINADDTLDEACVPDDLEGAPPWDRHSLKLTVGTPIAEAERRLVLSTLEHFNGDKKRAAQTLGVSLKTIYNRLQAWGVKGERFDADDAGDDATAHD